MPNRTGPSAETAPDPAAVARELERLAGSTSFRKAEQCLRLLRHLTGCALEGRGGELKEYAVGVAVFDRPASYDPRIDPIVRLEARRLRLKLAEYYQQEGQDDAVIIDLPKGAYVPDFRYRRLPEPEADPPLPVPPGHRYSLRMRLAAAAALLVASGACWYLFRARPPGLQVRTSIAVLGFRDLSAQNETAWISAALAEWMNLDLGAEQRLRTVPLENVARMRNELSLAPQSAFPAQLLQRIRRNLGSDYLIAGSYLPSGSSVHLDVVLFDARTARQVAAVAEDAAQDSLPDLARRCAQKIRAQLGVRLLAGGSPALDAAAMEPYARGMELLRQGDGLSARPYLEKAVAAAPSSPLTHSGLAAAWSALGLDLRASEEAKLAFDSSAALGRVEQLEIEGRYRATAHDWPRAVQVYQALFTLLPDDLEYGLLLAFAQLHGGEGHEALTTVAALRGLPPPLRDDPRIDLTEAQAAGALSDFAHTRKAAQTSAEKARALGARLLYAKARLLEAGAMQNLVAAGFADVRAEARRDCAELGDRACVAASYRIEANQMTATGNLAAARNLYQATLDVANQMGNANEKLNSLSGLANAAKMQGDLRAAEGYYRAALPVGEEMGATKRYPVSLNLAGVLMDEGRIAEARALIEEAQRLAQQTGEREGIGLSQAALARTLALQGKTGDALGAYTAALTILRDVHEPYQLLETLLDVGATQLEHGDLPAARKSTEEAQSLAGTIPGGAAMPEIAIAFARLDFADSHFAEAVSHARTALTGFTAGGQEGDRLEAAAVLMRALIAQGGIAEASAVLAQFPSPDENKLPAESVVQFQIARCFVLARSGRREEALRSMDAVSADAARSGLPKLVREASQARQAVASVTLSMAAR